MVETSVSKLHPPSLFFRISNGEILHQTPLDELLDTEPKPERLVGRNPWEGVSGHDERLQRALVDVRAKPLQGLLRRGIDGHTKIRLLFEGLHRKSEWVVGNRWRHESCG